MKEHVKTIEKTLEASKDLNKSKEEEVQTPELFHIFEKKKKKQVSNPLKILIQIQTKKETALLAKTVEGDRRNEEKGTGRDQETA